MPAFIDLTGKRFGRITAIMPLQKRTRNGGVVWQCRCDCGKEFQTTANALRTNMTTSCGCKRIEVLKNSPIHITHGGESDRLYGVWRGMKQRCKNPNHNRYRFYGGRGIKICPEWEKDYSAFREWAYANGYDEYAPRGECTIDRIDVDGDYTPENCRWVTMKVQNRNKRKDV